MPDIASRLQREAVAIRAVGSIPGARVSAQAIRKSGSMMNIITAIAAALAEDVEYRAMAKHLARTLDGAHGSELDYYVREITFGIVQRLGAAPAVMPIAISRPTAASLPAGTIKAGEIVAAGSLTFTLDASLSFAVGQLGPLPTSMTSVSAGLATNVPLATQLRFQNPAGLFDSNLVAIPTQDGAGGADVELDPDLKARTRRFPSAVMRGTLAAIEFGALTVPGVRQAVATEPIDVVGDALGKVILYIADANGNANTSLVNSVRQVLRGAAGQAGWRCGGSVVRCVGSVPSFVSVTLSIAYLDGYDTATVQSLARAAVVNAVNANKPNDKLLRSTIIAALRTVPGAVVSDSAIVSPVGDLAPATPGQTFRTRLDLVSFL